MMIKRGDGFANSLLPRYHAPASNGGPTSATIIRLRRLYFIGSLYREGIRSCNLFVKTPLQRHPLGLGLRLTMTGLCYLFPPEVGLMKLSVIGPIILALSPVVLAEGEQAKGAKGAAELLEDKGEELLPKLTNPTGCPGEGHVEKEAPFSGSSCVRIVPMQ